MKINVSYVELRVALEVLKSWMAAPLQTIPWNECRQKTWRSEEGDRGHN